MKQLQYTFNDNETLIASLKKIRTYYDENNFKGMLIHILTEITNSTIIRGFCREIERELPEALYVGSSSNGNIVEGDFSVESTALICTFFEKDSTKIRILGYRLTADTQEEVTEQLVKEVKENEWVKGVELLTTMRGMSTSGLCKGLSYVRPGVQIFGGGAFAEDVNNQEACVFSREDGFHRHGIVFILYGGPDFHISSSHVTGWKPLGTFLNVTAADGYYLKELNGKPAYDTYYKYLNIKNDENFFTNTLEFPFMYRHNGIDILRAPISSNPDGSLTLTADIEQNVRARLAYGDPWTILESTKEEVKQLEVFAPDCIFVFSCAGRRTFWGNDKIGKESLGYQRVCPTSGFYTSGEFLRHGAYVIQHNVTQVIVAMREGDVEEDPRQSLSYESTPSSDGTVSIISRLANFIKVTMEELEEANDMLSAMAITDGLTGLLNRGEIQRRITQEIEDKQTDSTYLMMLDLDDFKHVNDTWGHKEGDNVLIRVSGLLKETLVALNSHSAAGRWGGEEFMILLTNVSEKDVLMQAERIRRIMHDIKFPEAGQVTISIGVTQVIPGESADQACIRVDGALYDAKRTGKDKVIYRRASDGIPKFDKIY